MGRASRKKYTPEFNAKMVLEALKDRSSLTELSEKYEVSSVMISRRKNESLANASGAFGSGTARAESEKEKEKDRLHRKIGELEIELDFAKRVSKSWGS
jgi:transposase